MIDLINREELLRDLNIGKETLEYSIEHYDDTELELAVDKYGLYLVDGLIDTVKSYSPAQPERKKGKWIPSTEVFEGRVFVGDRCSVCNCWKSMGPWNFCSNCGADMRVKK